ncbi:MAG: hypothetical protein ABIM85_06215 [candidate division WOR-3 bacterium]
MKKYLLKFERFFNFFEKYNINFTIFGDTATYMWGVRKKIRYIDLIIDFEDKNLERFIKLMQNMGMKIKGNIKYKFLYEYLKNKESFQEEFLIFYHRRIFPWRIKLHLKENIKDYKIVEKKLGETKVYVISLEDLINLKKRKINLKTLQDLHFMKNVLSNTLEKVP